ncbi:MAG: transcription-repair coupling factor (superfamily II helicase) [Limisphaerales bacterium]
MLNSPIAQELRKQLETNGDVALYNISPAAAPCIAIALQNLRPGQPILIVADTLKTQETLFQDLQTWQAIATSEISNPNSQISNSTDPQLKKTLNSQLLFFPSWEIQPHEQRLPHVDVTSERLETLIKLLGPPDADSKGKSKAKTKSKSASATAPSPIVVTTAIALLQKTFSAKELRDRTRRLKRNDQLDPLDLIEWLEEQGYEPEAQVSQKGEIALRGGIVDIYPPSSPWPIRLEFFGDELESIRSFDPHTQISREEVDEATLSPAGELSILRKEFGGTPGKASKKEAAKPKSENSLSTLQDYLPEKPIVLLCEPDLLEEATDRYTADVPKKDPFHIPWDQLSAQIEARDGQLIELNEAESPIPETTSIDAITFGNLDAYRPLDERGQEPQIAEAKRRDFFTQLHRWMRQGQDVHVFCNNDGERDRFVEIWNDCGFSENPKPKAGAKSGSKAKDKPAPTPTLQIGALSRGFLCDAAKLIVVTDAEIFGRYKIQRPRRLKSPHAAAVTSALDINFTDLEIGDLVVHLHHGIGKYTGLEILAHTRDNISRGDMTAEAETGQECLVIEYAPKNSSEANPRLFVPVTHAHLVSKYVGSGKANPRLNRLGTKRWKKTKDEAQDAVRDLAAELLSIHAEREALPGYAFKEDVAWQREFEDAFIFEETPDQDKAIDDTKSDMERARPMDRLICGDVGFGKTEVAIRAAFKAVMEGRQVAILVPTTVLAQQHFNNFRERMADYPIRIELLSRFRTRKQQDIVIRDLGMGTVDIVIGTHRLVQKDVRFKDLGLAVIDEEQRFGVAHKETFKLMRRMVDVLTLSATPIPRTLYLALTGARDMSAIETPPLDRLPVETVVTHHDERLIRNAIQHEMNRGGQIYYVHNRVHSIMDTADRLKFLCPEARIVVGHGQMPTDQLEDVMGKFINGDADILLCTTIIESGLDIPNANTMIIDRADRFGLSDLYQLRGRVGRYTRQAYAYLFVPRYARLIDDARKRMSAIKQYSALGSGFKIAMRDLEIRGAGNLLGTEQSGHITAVGFELYCQLLKQSVAILKGEPVKKRVQVFIDIDFLALSPGDDRASANSQLSTQKDSQPNAATPCFIPFQYIPEPQQRVDIYRKLAQIADKPDLDALQKELRDRFGPLPDSLELLLQLTGLKLLASERNINVIQTRGTKLKLQRNDEYITAGGRFPRLTKKTASARLNEIRRLIMVF